MGQREGGRESVGSAPFFTKFPCCAIELHCKQLGLLFVIVLFFFNVYTDMFFLWMAELWSVRDGQ